MSWFFFVFFVPLWFNFLCFPFSPPIRVPLVFGRLELPHATFETPMFMPVGTQATVKALTPASSQGCRQGRSFSATRTTSPCGPATSSSPSQAGFTSSWAGTGRGILTDSGGFQVFSLAEIRSMTDQAAFFKSHIDGKLLELSPERAIHIQENLAAPTSPCASTSAPPAGRLPRGDASRRSSHDSVGRSLPGRPSKRPGQALFAIVQGGTDVGLRTECRAALVRLDFPGYALGGFSVGETGGRRCSQPSLPHPRPHCRSNKPRYSDGRSWRPARSAQCHCSGHRSVRLHDADP